MAIQTQLQSQFDFMKQREAEQIMPSFDYDALYHKSTQRILRTLRKPRRTRVANPAKYRAFLADVGLFEPATDALQETGGLYNPARSFEEFADEKRRLLELHLPWRYVTQGMEDYDDAKLGATFNHIVKSAYEIVRRDTRH